LKESLYSRWVSIGDGDYVLFYHAGKIVYASKVFFKYPFVIGPEQVKVGNYLAESIWGKDVDGKTWPYLFFLRDVIGIDLPLSKINELTGYNLKAIAGFMKIREERASKVIDHLQQVYGKPHVITKSKPPIQQDQLQHDQIVDAIYAIGELIGYRPEKKYRHERYEFDVVWHRPPRIGPKYVFEVHVKGSLEAALLRLKHAYDIWESQIFLVSTEVGLEEAESKFLGELHELKDKVTLLNIENVEEFYKFKGKFEWIERKFGLKPT
jgi:predicted RNA-binding protein